MDNFPVQWTAKPAVETPPPEHDSRAFIREGDTISFDSTLYVVVRGAHVGKTFRHTIAVERIEGGGAWVRLVARGVEE